MLTKYTCKKITGRVNLCAVSSQQSAVSSQQSAVSDLSLQKLQNERVTWVDFARITCAFLVVLAHVTAPYSQVMPGDVPDVFWLFGNFVDTFCRCAVPMFLMISGYLLLNKKGSLKPGYFNRLLKVGIPLLVWSAIYLVIRWWIGDVDRMGNPIGTYMFFNNPENLYKGIGFIFSGHVGHLWFLYTILSLYIVAPILHSYLKSASRESKTYFLLLCIFVCFLYPLICIVLKKIFNIDTIGLDFYLINTNIGYFIAGYFLGRFTITPRTCLLCLGSFVLVTVAITWIGFMFSYSDIFDPPDNRRLYFLGYYNMRIPLSLLLFVVIKHIGERPFRWECMTRFRAKFSHFASYAFGIYIVHVLIMHAIGDGALGFSFNIHTFAPWFSVPLVSLTVFCLSILMVWLLRKIPLVQRILP